jgi:hypothetical protein
MGVLDMRGMTGRLAGVALVLALAACSGGEKSTGNETATASVTGNAQNIADAPVTAANADANAAVDGAALEASDPTSSISGDCYLKIDGKVYLDIKKDCPMVSLHDGHGGLILNSDGENQTKTYFAYLTPNGDGTAGASWNAEPGATHAQSLLSENLKRDGACWFDSRVRICAIRR